MIVSEAIRGATTKLEGTSDTARLDAELLMAHAFTVSRSDLLLRHMQDAVPDGFDPLIARRANHEPVAYITGKAEFFGRPFTVTRDVLIPRPDSETLIEAALEWAGGRERLTILDLGTGSGALLLTLLAELPVSHGTGIDASKAAAGVARHNARLFEAADLLPRHGISREMGRHRILQRDWREPGWTERLNPFHLIVCNPPYVETDAKLDKDVREYEPASALFSGRDGLDDYRILLPQIRSLMLKDGIAIFEIGASQAEAVTQIAQYEGFDVTVRKDLAGRPRCLVLR